MTSQPAAPPGMWTESQLKGLLGEPSHPVDTWEVNTGEDHFDDPAIWVLVILESSQDFEKRDEIHKRVRKAIADSGEQRWVYVQFRTKEEQEELNKLEQEEEEVQERQEALEVPA